MSLYSFRTAKIEDIPKLVGLLHQLFSQEVEFTPDADKQTSGLHQIVGNDQIGKILIAIKDDEIIGMVNLLYTVSTYMGSRVCILEDMIISSPHRSSGVGSQLLHVAVQVATSDGCGRITLLTDHDNIHAQRFYGKHGFTRSSMIPMRRIID